MTKRTLIERMKRRDAPKAWITEVKQMTRSMEAAIDKIGEYAEIINSLAQEKRTTNANLRAAFYQIERAIGQLNSTGELLAGDIQIDIIIDSVVAQLEAYLEAIDNG